MAYPPKFTERLDVLIPEQARSHILNPRDKGNKSVRINTLKTTSDEIYFILKNADIKYSLIEWSKEALIITAQYEPEEVLQKLMDEGKLYSQSLASMYVAKVLAPLPDENVLDLCAAPGSKTSQIAAIMNNTGKIMAVESVRNRYYKLKAVLSIMDVKNAQPVFADGRRFRSKELFDKILVDAPCSTESRFQPDDHDSYKYWSERKIKEMNFKQKGLLLNAGRFLKPGGTMVYSTCTFAPEENEEVIDWFLNKTNEEFSMVNIENQNVDTYPCLTQWKNRMYDSRVSDCIRILPSKYMEGFFIAKLRRNPNS